MELTKHENIGIFQIVFSIPIYPLQRGFTPQNLSLTPKFEESSILLYNGCTCKKNKRSEQIYPQFQNVVGILILTAVLSLNFQASQNREKKVFIYRPTRSHYNLIFQCITCQHWFHPECQDIKLKACQLKNSRTVGCFEC